MIWHSIESSPRDGTPILACRDNGCGWDYVAVWWSAHDETYPWHDEAGNGYPADRYDFWTPIEPPSAQTNDPAG